MSEPADTSPGAVFRVFLRLGLTSFGGPVAHIGYFRDEFVARRKWLSEAEYADLVALCQFLPGPASSQVGIGLGLGRAGFAGAAAAWTGFTLPSALAMILFAYGVAAFGDVAGAGWLSGLKAMAVAVVAQAVWGMAKSLCPEARTATIALGAAALVIAWPLVLGHATYGQIVAILIGGVLGRLFLSGTIPDSGPARPFPVSRRTGLIAGTLFLVLLVGLPALAWATADPVIAIVDSFYRAGSLVFGGGHVVLPLLQAETVPPGWVTVDQFLAGYGAAQAVPGPLFTFSAYLGTVMEAGPGGVIGVLALMAIFAPAFLLVVAALPFWNALRTRPAARSALAGVNATVVGLLLAALYNPVWTAAVRGPGDVVLVLAAFAMLAVWKWAPWIVAPIAAVLGTVAALL